MRRIFVLGMLCALLVSTVAIAGDAPKEGARIAKYIWVEHATLNTGKALVFSKLVGQLREAANSSNAELYWLAGSNITGNLREASFVTFHDSLASVDRTLETLHNVERAAMVKNASLMAEAAESEQSAHSVLAKYREDISFNPTKVDAAFATRWWVMTFYLKPGSDTEFTELMKEHIELRKKGNIEQHWIAYQAMAGTPGPAVMLVIPLRSLADLDVDQSESFKAVFTPTIKKQLESVVRNCVTKVVSTFLAVRPDLSRPPQTILAANPDFWTVKETTPVLAKGKKAPKSAVQPAALKENR